MELTPSQCLKNIIYNLKCSILYFLNNSLYLSAKTASICYIYQSLFACLIQLLFKYTFHIIYFNSIIQINYKNCLNFFETVPFVYFIIPNYLNSGQKPLLASIKSSNISFATVALGTVFDNVIACHNFS